MSGRWETIKFGQSGNFFKDEKIMHVEPEDDFAMDDMLFAERSKSYSDLLTQKHVDAMQLNVIKKSASMIRLRTPVLVSYEHAWDDETDEEDIKPAVPIKPKRNIKHPNSVSHTDLASVRTLRRRKKMKPSRRASLDALIDRMHQRAINNKRIKLSINTLDFRVCKMRILATLEIVERVVSSPYISEEFKLETLEKFDELFTTYLFERIKFNKIDDTARPSRGEIREFGITGDYDFLNF